MPLSGREIEQLVREAAAAAINQAAENLLGEATQRVPVDEGTLRASGAVDKATPMDLEATVSFNTPYAAAQHEAYALMHRNGRSYEWRARKYKLGGGSKYLENPLKEQAARYEQHLANAIRKTLDATRDA